jgi:hypothetical protein
MTTPGGISTDTMPDLGIGSNWQAGTMNGDALPRTIDPNGDVTTADNNAIANAMPSIPNPFSGFSSLVTNLEFGGVGLAAGIVIAVIIYLAIKF